MKNYILILIMFITIFIAGCNNDQKNNEKLNNNNNSNLEDAVMPSIEEDPTIGTHEVNFYLFYLSTCSHCHEEMEWIKSIKDEYPYVNFNMYEITENEDLFFSVNESFGTDNVSVPVTIIGNEYMIGYSETRNRKFIRTMKELSTFESCDVVQATIDGNDIESCMKQNEK